uniref:ZP domain-containing protein n=2 Tax=Meloidogyne TaxID=189290 RepID=A0A915NRF6_9BILA
MFFLINHNFKYLIKFIFIILFVNQLNYLDGRLLDTSVACDQHNFLLSLNFDVPFRGLVYSEEGLPNCIYVNGTMLSQLNYHLKVPLNGCETKINLDGNFENGVIIQENIGFLQASDKKYLLTCIPSSPLINPQTNTVTTTTITPLPPPLLTTKSSTTTTTLAFGEENEAINVDLNELSSKPKEYITSSSSSSSLNPPQQQQQIPSLDEPTIINKNSELKYSVEIKSGHNFEEFSLDSNNLMPSYLVRIQKPVSDSQIGRCWATDSNSSLELSDERGCSLQPKGNIWGAFERVETQEEVVFINRIKAWAFPTSNEVNIFCNLRICMSKHCSFITNCSELTRQRRNDENNGILEEIEILKTLIKLNRNKRNIPSLIIENNYCNKQKEILNEEENNWLWCISLTEMFIVCICCGLISILIAAITKETKTENNIWWSFLDGTNKKEKRQNLTLSRYFV